MITVTFDNDNALVLFEFLTKIVDAQDNNKTLDDGTLQAINNLICEFESELVEPMQPNYDYLLKDAQTRLAFSTMDVIEF